MTRPPKRPAHKRCLTELYVRKLQPQTNAFVVWDTRQYGLALRVQPRSSRRNGCAISHTEHRCQSIALAPRTPQKSAGASVGSRPNGSLKSFWKLSPSLTVPLPNGSTCCCNAWVKAMFA